MIGVEPPEQARQPAAPQPTDPAQQLFFLPCVVRTHDEEHAEPGGGGGHDGGEHLLVVYLFVVYVVEGVDF